MYKAKRVFGMMDWQVRQPYGSRETSAAWTATIKQLMTTDMSAKARSMASIVAMTWYELGSPLSTYVEHWKSHG